MLGMSGADDDGSKDRDTSGREGQRTGGRACRHDGPPAPAPFSSARQQTDFILDTKNESAPSVSERGNGGGRGAGSHTTYGS